ncbi:MAG TPA: plastocyanin/azurin family copper-binding protein [Chloroflexota bacterium]|nr:plastocyanin/azurin family copper-binding protein [Chloroflexota bacterium]
MQVLSIRRIVAVLLALLVATPFGYGVLPSPAAAGTTTWQDVAGAERGDEGIEALAYLPTEFVIHDGDSITWTFPTGEPHTVTLVYPFGTSNLTHEKCNGTDSNTGACTWDGSSGVNSGRIQDGGTFTVTFGPAVSPGDYVFQCLFHKSMTGTVHVQAANTSYPHDQQFYTQQGQQQARQLIQEANQLAAEERQATVAGHSGDAVTIGDGFATSTSTSNPSGTLQSVMIARFLQPTTTVHVGDTVTFTANDANTPHTVTLGVEPGNPQATVGLTVVGTPSPPVAGAATPSSPYPQLGVGPTISSGFLGDSVPIWHGSSFKLTFTQAGTYRYYCALHDDLGMVGTVNVIPKGHQS